MSSAPSRGDTENASRLVNALIEKGMTAGVAIVEEIQGKLRGLTRRSVSWQEYLQQARRVIARHEPILARTLSDTLLAGWLTGAEKPALKLPAEPMPSAFIAPEAPPLTLYPKILPEPPGPPFVAAEAIPGEPEPLIRFPVIEKAAKNLFEREIMVKADFNRLASEAKQAAFTVARVSSLDALEKIQGALFEDVQHGKTLADFRGKIAETLEGTALSPAHVENIYRSNVAQAYSAGLDEVLNHPLVADEFPYLEYNAVHDERTEDTHLEMEHLGIQGTNIYRRDDPIWEKFFPPWRYQCRCMVRPMTLEEAAKAGIREAQRWLETGVPPVVPAWVQAPPFNPPVGWGTRPRLVAVA